MDFMIGLYEALKWCFTITRSQSQQEISTQPLTILDSSDLCRSKIIAWYLIAVRNTENTI